MKKFCFQWLIASLAFVIVANGCAVIGSHNGPRPVVFLQRGVILQVTHTCTGYAQLYQAGRGLVAHVRGAAPVEVPLGPAMWGNREVAVTLQSVNESGNVVGVHVERFYIDRDSTSAKTWLVSNGWGGSPNRHSRCGR